MPTTIEELRQFLNSKNVKYLYDSQKETFIVSFTPHVVLIRLEESGEFLQFRTLNFYQYKSGKYLSSILEMLASINYRRKLVKFGYDTEDGEINGCIDIPIEDANFTSTQFFRCMAALLEALEEGHERIIKILETGKDPGPGNSKIIDSLVNEIMNSTDTDEDNPESSEEDRHT